MHREGISLPFISYYYRLSFLLRFTMNLCAAHVSLPCNHVSYIIIFSLTFYIIALFKKVFLQFFFSIFIIFLYVCQKTCIWIYKAFTSYSEFTILALSILPSFVLLVFLSVLLLDKLFLACPEQYSSFCDQYELSVLFLFHFPLVLSQHYLCA